MIDETDLETYLYISKDKFLIFLFDKKNFVNLYKNELIHDREINFTDLTNLSKFLDENIFKIEKLVGDFIKNIFLIIENDKNLIVNIGIKKKNYENFLNQKYLENSLTELKDLFKENYHRQDILHMIINKYIINGKSYSSIVSDFKSDHLCLEISFISISNDLVIALNKVLEKFQIKISKFFDGEYVKNLSNEDNIELSQMAHKLKNGHNINEVTLVPKNIENKGLFEKFFQLFS